MHFPQNGKKDFYEQMRGLRLIFQVGGPAVLRFMPFFPTHGCVKDSGKQVDKLTNVSKDDFKSIVRPFLATPQLADRDVFHFLPLTRSP